MVVFALPLGAVGPAPLPAVTDRPLPARGSGGHLAVTLLRNGVSPACFEATFGRDAGPLWHACATVRHRHAPQPIGEPTLAFWERAALAIIADLQRADTAQAEERATFLTGATGKARAKAVAACQTISDTLLARGYIVSSPIDELR